MQKTVCALMILCLTVLSVLYPLEGTGKEMPRQVLLANAATTGNDAGTYDVNVKITIKVTLDDKVKNVNPNIIRAARQALFGSSLFCMGELACSVP